MMRLEPFINKTTRTVSYKLSDKQFKEALIEYFRRRGIHAPDQNKAEYSFYRSDRIIGGTTYSTISWEEPA